MSARGRSGSAPTQVRFFSDTVHEAARCTPRAGSNVIVAGTAIFNAPEPEKVIALLKATVDSAQAKAAQR